MQYYANIPVCIVAISGSTPRIRSVNMGSPKMKTDHTVTHYHLRLFKLLLALM